jgi:hypothetical protein
VTYIFVNAVFSNAPLCERTDASCDYEDATTPSAPSKIHNSNLPGIAKCRKSTLSEIDNM